MTIDASFEWNKHTKKLLEEAPEKMLRQVARMTLDLTGSSKVTAYNTGKTEQSMYTAGVAGNMNSGFYIGNFTNYASYVYPKHNVHWTNPNTQPKWFEYIWERNGQMITDTAIRDYKL